ncbi:MAG: PHB depolymerase family esterase [Chloroflexota bacterium]
MRSKPLYKIAFAGMAVVLLLSSCRLGKNPNRPAQQDPTPSGESTQVTETSPTSAPEALTFQTGRNDYVITVDETPREFIIHVPSGYDASKPTPVVFMFHGSRQTGEMLYQYSTWRQKGEKENFITVYPTSWEYLLTTTDQVETKWNDIGLKNITPAGTELKDDVKFVSAMMELLRVTFNVDEKRVYASGFSNGGSFVLTRLLFEMHDTFASFGVSASGISLGNEAFANLPPQTIGNSLYVIIGTEDEVISSPENPRPFPLAPDEIWNDPYFGPMLRNTAAILSLEPTYEVSGQEGDITIFRFANSETGANNEYIFEMVKGLTHLYPKGDDNDYNLNAASIFWEFFTQHPMK